METKDEIWRICIREFSFHWEARINWLRTEHYPISPRDSYSKWCKFWQKSALVEQNGFGDRRIWKNMKQYHSEINLTSPYGAWSLSTPVTLSPKLPSSSFKMYGWLSVDVFAWKYNFELAQIGYEHARAQQRLQTVVAGSAHHGGSACTLF